jgi:hypothetical protein
MEPNAVQKLLALPGSHPVFSQIARTFDLMEVAEKVIAAEKAARKPRLRKRVDSAFKLLVPGLLLEFGDDLYRFHCREIIRRVVAGADTRPGTKAEVLANLSRATLESRLQHDAELLALTLADEVFPGRNLVGDENNSESFAGSLGELLAECRRKTAQDWRAR